MAKRDSKATPEQQPSEAASTISAITQSRPLIWLLSLIVLTLVSIFVVAFFQGRSISFWPPSIGAIPTTVAQSATSLTVTDVASGSTSDQLAFDAIPFIAFAWSTAVVKSEAGWAYLSVINDPSTWKKYQLEFTLPMTSTGYSGAGLTFRFSEPQDLTGYSYVSIDVEFESPGTRCDFILLDVSNNSKSVPLSPNIALNPDVSRQRMGLSETFTIPLEAYFGGVSRKDIKEFACATDVNISPGNHKVIIGNIVFSK